ncbi:MAG: hypothetical protein AB7Q97_20735 [Gammaproteobacteria bacterium]
MTWVAKSVANAARRHAAGTFQSITAALVAIGVGDAHAQDPPAAQWQPQQIVFRFRGHDTFYSCEAVVDKLKKLLVAAGARADANASARCPPQATQDFSRLPPGMDIGTAIRWGTGLESRYDITLGFSTALPAASGPTTETFAVAWRTVTMREGRPRFLDRGDCELVEQFARAVLPLFPLQAPPRVRACLAGAAPRLEFTVLAPVDGTEQGKEEHR